MDAVPRFGLLASLSPHPLFSLPHIPNMSTDLNALLSKLTLEEKVNMTLKLASAE